ncbi:MAG TPA: MarR family transcriptional regulator [Ktedonobacterales bacterium]|nr:MarR family transcriptional regulator [Ktedonobacterales bacterium]
MLAWMRLARVFQKVDRASAEHLRAWGLSIAQFDVIAQVGSAEGITQQELADKLLVTKGNICQLLDRLEQHGLIRRRQEGRVNHLFLTDAGQRLYQQTVPAQETFIAGQFAALAPEEQTQLLTILRKLDHALD